MRSLRTLMAAAWILGIAPGFADAQTSPAPKDLLKFIREIQPAGAALQNDFPQRNHADADFIV